MLMEILCLTISQNTICKHCVVELCFYVRVSDYYKSTLRLCYMFIHYLHISLPKVLIVKLKIFKVLRIVYIKPQHVHLEPVLCKHVVSLHHQFRADRRPLTKMKSETVCWRHIWVTWYFSKTTLSSLWTKCWCENKKFQRWSFRNETNKRAIRVSLRIKNVNPGVTTIHPS